MKYRKLRREALQQAKGFIRRGTFPSITEATEALAAWARTAHAGGLALPTLLGVIDNCDQSRVVCTFATREWALRHAPELASQFMDTDDELLVLAFDGQHFMRDTLSSIRRSITNLNVMEAINGV
jgi:hypothetical protein